MEQKKPTINNVSLLQLADHLEKGELLHEKFDIDAFNKAIDGILFEKLGVANCGTSGCALGEMPLLDKRWIFSRCSSSSGTYVYFESNSNFRSACQEYWGLTQKECIHLFVSDNQSIELYGGKVLTSRATKKQVAKNIRIFVKKTGKNECIISEPTPIPK